MAATGALSTKAAAVPGWQEHELSAAKEHELSATKEHELSATKPLLEAPNSPPNITSSTKGQTGLLNPNLTLQTRNSKQYSGSPVTPFLMYETAKIKDSDLSPQLILSAVSVRLDLQSSGAGGPTG